jgi:hypothetical protein
MGIIEGMVRSMEAIVRVVEQPVDQPEGRRSVGAERALRELDAVRRFVARGPYGGPAR